MEVGRALWRMALLMTAIVVSFRGEVVTADGQPAGGPDTNVLCISKCGTCPTVCSPPPPSPKSGSGYSPSPPSRSSSPPPPSGQTKGGRSGNYYYFFTAGRGPSCTASSVYTSLFLVILSLVAVLLQ